MGGAKRRDERGRSVLGAAGLVSGLTLLSRLLGLGRDALTTHALGRSAALDTFVVAWMLPNLLRRLFGEGALTAALVPELTARRAGAGGDAAARRLLGAVLWALGGALGALALAVVALGLLLPPAATAAGDGDPAQSRLFGELLALLFPYALPICLVATLSGALNVLGRFAPGALAPALLNVFWIGGLAYGLAYHPDDPPAIVRGVGVALLLGGLAQLALVAVPLARLGQLPLPRRPRAGDGSADVFRRMLPTVLGMSALQLNVLVDQAIAYWLVGSGANSSLFLANRLLLFPHALIALPLATAAFPQLAADANRDDLQALREGLGRAVRITTWFALPAAAGMALVAGDLIGVAFEHGAFDARDTGVTRWTTVALVASLPGVGAAQLLARACYALGEQRKPARIALRLVGVNAVLNLLLARGLGLGAPGLALATTLTAYLNLLALRGAMRADARPALELRRLGRTLLASAAMGGVVAATQSAWSPDGRLERVIAGLVLPIIAGIGSYFAVHHLLGGSETRIAVAALRRRRATRSA